ncbi:hypothetical protein FSP39_023178 [Pinctada imbricata]|uniref:TIR domain-containing protein n=1 Tax=Pinctada imbricata TaxID=66713 RepID=A0AA88Y5B5_PINIB|nr:hypothetical protein FSP39_023178 [Pinctada imbricata]
MRKIPSEHSKEADLNTSSAKILRLFNSLILTWTYLFISYCDVDAPDDRSEVIHPATVHEDLINAGYTCWFPEVTNKYSTDLMARALMDSTIFVVFMSTSYANDPTCADIFKYAKLTLGKPMVVIVVGEENFSWRKTNLGLLLPDVSFVNMINSKKQMYDGKFRELLQKLDELMNLATRNVSTESPECFISYCWKNSAQAVALGTRAEDKSLGYGDPREIKNYLEEEGVRCWIDVERIGMNGLFDEIAKGLLEAKMVVACVSDEYVQSPSCKKEFHYACTVLNIPIVLCVVGTGSEWRRSEVGILSVNCPIVSFQLESEAANNRLLELVQDSIQKVGKQDNNTNNNKAAEKTTEEELYELAQRKFLRQIVNYASSHDVEPYPRIFMVDLVKQENQSTTQEDPEQEKQDPEKLKASISMEDKSDAFRLRQYCVYILCECDKGWHTVDEPMMLPEDFGSDLLDQFAPYLCRVTAIMKHSKTMVPNFLSDPDGQQYTKWLFESTAAVVPDFKTGYHQFRELVMNLDIHNKAGKLSRCRQTSGKTIWLCSQHVSEMKVTVLGKDTAPIKQKASVQTAINYTEEWLRKLDPKRLQAKFKSSKKADRKPVGMYIV